MILRALIAAASVAAGLALAGCGFRPIHAEGPGASAENLAQVRIETIPDRLGQQLHNMLLDRLNPRGQPERPTYVLTVRLNEVRQELAIRRDESATRANLIINAQFVLTPADARDRRQFRGSAVSTNSYNRLRSDFATLSAEEDTRVRALRALADDIRLRVAAALENPQAFLVARPAPPPAPPVSPTP